LRVGDIVKTKLKTKKKEKSKFRKDDYETLNQVNNQVIKEDIQSLPFIRPEMSMKKSSPVYVSQNKNNSTKKDKKQSITRNKELEQSKEHYPSKN
jgi:hypothetical protein